LLCPATSGELAEALATAAARRQTITLAGHFSKRQMAGPVASSEMTLSTARLNRVLQYEPRDLTISVEAGLGWAELSEMLARNRQMIPLDPPFWQSATVGGVVASNSSGPRRRLYGTARDLVIGMKFATLGGKLVESGGMVVKNVAGLDMGKLLIGSFGTLAALAVVNFKLLPMPAADATFLLCFDGVQQAIAARDKLLQSPLQPAALDLLNRAAAARFGGGGGVLAVRAGGNAAALKRYEREMAALGEGVSLAGEEAEAFWEKVREFTPGFLAANPDGAVARVSSKLSELGAVLESTQVPLIARAGSGVCYGYFERAVDAAQWAALAEFRGWRPVIEFAPEDQKAELDLWPGAGTDSWGLSRAPSGRPPGATFGAGREFAMMVKIKQMFDPERLLNRGRLYRRI